MTYEDLKIENPELNISEMDLSDVTGLKGLYVDGNIAVEKNMSEIEKACVLAEEIGHHKTSVGNILDLNDVGNRKQERKARLWAYNKQIGLSGLVRAFEHGCQTRYEIAEYLEVTEEFLQECVDCYREKYGIGIEIDNYYITFIPHLRIGKLGL